MFQWGSRVGSMESPFGSVALKDHRPLIYRRIFRLLRSLALIINPWERIYSARGTRPVESSLKPRNKLGVCSPPTNYLPNEIRRRTRDSFEYFKRQTRCCLAEKSVLCTRVRAIVCVPFGRTVYPDTHCCIFPIARFELNACSRGAYKNCYHVGPSLFTLSIHSEGPQPRGPRPFDSRNSKTPQITIE